MEKKKSYSQCKMDLVPVGFGQFSIGWCTDGTNTKPFLSLQGSLAAISPTKGNTRGLTEATPAQGSKGTTTFL